MKSTVCKSKIQGAQNICVFRGTGDASGPSPNLQATEDALYEKAFYARAISTFEEEGGPTLKETDDIEDRFEVHSKPHNMKTSTCARTA